jgi:NTE family protein
LRNDVDVQRLSAVCKRGEVSLVHLINRRYSHSASSKDYEFSRATVTELWASGRDDVRRSIANPEWRDASESVDGMRVYDLSR